MSEPADPVGCEERILGKQRCSGQAGYGSKAGALNNEVLGGELTRPRVDGFADRCEERLARCGKAPADNDCLGVDQSHDVGQCLAKGGAGFFKECQGPVIPTRSEFDDVGSGPDFVTAGHQLCPHHGSTCYGFKPLEATARL